MSEDQTEEPLPPGIRGSKQDIQELLDQLNAVEPETGKTQCELFEEGLRHEDYASEAFWKSLTKEQQLQAFCAVSRRIRKGEIELGGSYRYVLNIQKSAGDLHRARSLLRFVNSNRFGGCSFEQNHPKHD